MTAPGDRPADDGRDHSAGVDADVEPDVEPDDAPADGLAGDGELRADVDGDAARASDEPGDPSSEAAAEATEPPPTLPPAPDPLLPVGPRTPSGWPRIAASVGLFLVVVSLPLWVGQRGASFLVDLALLVAVAQWWSMLAGFAGTPSLAAGFYAGSGAYVWMALVQWAGLNPVVAVAVAGVGAGVLAVPTGWLLLRLAPAWTALAGLVLAAAASSFIAVVDEPSVAGRTVSAVAELGPTLRRSLTTWLAVVVGVGSVAAAVALRRSRLGLAVIAHRDDPEAASTLGVRASSARLVLWTLAAATAGTAGAIVHFRSGTTAVDEAFSPIVWVLAPLVAATLGGMRSLSGPVIGAVVYVVAERIFGTAVALTVCAVAAAALLVLVPRGLADHAVPVVLAKAEPLLAKVRPLLSSPKESSTATTARP